VRIDLNADVGEASTPLEETTELALIALVTSVNVACGAHAGDPAAIRRTIAVAAARGVCIGAHPGYADRQNRGRRPLAVSPDEVFALVTEQVRYVAALARERGTSLSHVKAHGALYNQASANRGLADAVARAVRTIDPSLRLIGLAGSAQIKAGRAAGLVTLSEAFVDRAYTADGALLPRSEPGAVIRDRDTAVAQALTILMTRTVRAVDGTLVQLHADTLCLHGDTPGAVHFARRLRAALAEKGVQIGLHAGWARVQ
jgi:5-oxoprolinase (ATP-hydrolysing) subunit A